MSCIASKKIGNENSIYCYEVNPILADVCRNTAKDNNCNVNVIEKISTEGNLFEINGKKDVLICETIGNFLIEEHMLTIVNHAHDTFLTDNPTVIPKSGKVYGYLCSSPQQNSEFIANNSSFENINISYFKNLIDDSHKITKPITANIKNEEIIRLSDSEILFDFDFTKKNPEEGKNIIKFNVKKSGILTGIILHFTLNVDDENIIYSGRQNGSWSDVLKSNTSQFFRKVNENEIITAEFNYYKNDINVFIK